MRKVAWMAGVVVMFSVRLASAASLGIPLDGFLISFEAFVTGLGLLFGLVGLLGFVASRLDNNFGHVLAGSPGLFILCGFLGGGAVILGQLGLVSGAVLP